MAKKNLTINFKNCTISLENNEIVEYGKDSIESHCLSDFIKTLDGEGRRFDITFKEVVDLIPTSVDG